MGNGGLVWRGAHRRPAHRDQSVLMPGQQHPRGVGLHGLHTKGGTRRAPGAARGGGSMLRDGGDGSPVRGRDRACVSSRRAGGRGAYGRRPPAPGKTRIRATLPTVTDEEHQGEEPEEEPELFHRRDTHSHAGGRLKPQQIRKQAACRRLHARPGPRFTVCRSAVACPGPHTGPHLLAIGGTKSVIAEAARGGGPLRIRPPARRPDDVRRRTTTRSRSSFWRWDC